MGLSECWSYWARNCMEKKSQDVSDLLLQQEHSQQYPCSLISADLILSASGSSVKQKRLPQPHIGSENPHGSHF